MSLTNLQSYIKTTTDQKVEAIITEAKKEESKIVSEARQKAKKIQNEIIKTKQEELALKERSILAMEELNWKKKILETKASLLDKMFTEAENHLSKIIKKPQYREFLEKSTLEGIMNITGNDYVINANKNDAKLLQNALNKIQKEVEKRRRKKVKIELSQNNITTKGGVLVSDKMMQQYYNNTVEARLQRSKLALEGKLYKDIFRGN